MTITEKLAELCNVKPTDVKIIGNSGYWILVEYTLGGKKCQATLLAK